MLKPSAPRGNQSYSLVIVVRVTTHCPQACLYCGYSRAIHKERGLIDSEKLNRFGQALKEYKTDSGREILVCWLGGEPYLWPQLWPTTELFHDQFDLSVGITTAGMTLHDATDRQNTLRWIDELTISVDGFADHHDWVRGTAGGWQKLKQRVYQIAQTRTDSAPVLRANLVLMRRNIDQFAAICQELVSWGFDELCFNQLGGLDRPEFYPDNRLQPEQWSRFRQQFPKLRQSLADQGVSLIGSDSYLDRLGATTSGTRLPIIDCQPGTEFWFVDELGRLSPCSYTSSTYYLPIEELRTAADLRRIPSLLRSQRNQTSCLACADCHATHKFAKFRKASLRIHSDRIESQS